MTKEQFLYQFSDKNNIRFVDAPENERQIFIESCRRHSDLPCMHGFKFVKSNHAYSKFLAFDSENLEENGYIDEKVYIFIDKTDDLKQTIVYGGNENCWISN